MGPPYGPQGMMPPPHAGWRGGPGGDYREGGPWGHPADYGEGPPYGGPGPEYREGACLPINRSPRNVEMTWN